MIHLILLNHLTLLTFLTLLTLLTFRSDLLLLPSSSPAKIVTMSGPPLPPLKYDQSIITK